MFGAISKLFKRSERAASAPVSPFPQLPGRGATATSPDASPASPNNEAIVTPLPKAALRRSLSGEALSIPYSSIIKLVPQELWGKLAPAGVAGYNFAVSRKTVTEQIHNGAVKVSFADLRRGAPSGVFVTGTAEDGRMIDLPLVEILAQLHPDAYARRPNQVPVQVSQDVPDLFGAKGERLANVRVLEKKAAKESNTTTLTRQKVPVAVPPGPAATSAPSPNVTPLPIPQPPPLAPESLAPAVPAPVPAPIPAPSLRMASAVPLAPKPPAAIPIAAPKPIAAPGQASPRPLPKPTPPRPAPTAPAPAIPSPVVPQHPAVTPIAPIQTSPSLVAAVNALGFGSQPFLVAVDQIASAWPTGVRQELAQLKIPDAKLAFPPVEICEGLKRGRIQYAWRTLRSWLHPTPFYATASPHDDVVVELPLSILTPLFLEFIRANASDKTVASAAGITEFFRRAEAFAGASHEPIRAVEATTSISLQPAHAGQAQVPTVPVPQPVPSSATAYSEATDISLAPGVAAIENGKLCLPVNQISQGWPEPILREIQQFSLATARIEIPVEHVEGVLKSGRIEFFWKELCAWLRPESRAAQVSINGEVRLPLPLNVVAPLFLKQREPAGAKKRVSVAESIPDVFSAAGKPVVASSVAALQGVADPEPPPPPPALAAPAMPAAPPAQPAVPFVSAPDGARKLPSSVSELFNDTEKKSWTPNEIVHRTTMLPNVAGAMIAMQDGLLVAHCMPPTMKTETIAAFVPQIFGRLNQYCKELQLGDAKSVSFTVESGTVQVFNAGIIYFAALSKPDALLPLPELQLIATELSRHTK